MIKYSQIIKKVNELLKEEFGVLIDDLDLKEKFVRPSFKVEIDDVKHEIFMTTLKKLSFVIRIYYFMPTKLKADKLDVMQKLQDLFSLVLVVEEYPDGSRFLLPIDELTFVENDGVLIASFETYTYEELEKDIELEYMEELKGGIK